MKSGDYELRIDLEDQAGERAYAGYTNFTIGGPSTSYLLNVSGFHGNAGTYTKHEIFKKHVHENLVTVLLLKL